MPPKKRIHSKSQSSRSKKLKLTRSDDDENISKDTELSDDLPEISNNTDKTDNNNASLTSSPSLSSIQLPISERLLLIEQELCQQLKTIKFPSKVEYVYNPIIYAFEVHAKYVQTYCNESKKILFLGMNPGPWGMSQTGVPFGEISMVRDWLKIQGFIGKPSKEQPDRKVTGFDCKRSEISGKRLWGLFKDLCGTPQNFFKHSYVHNYCPIALMDRKGKNITPADLKKEEQKLIHELCDQALSKIIQLLDVKIVVGVGRFAEKRAQAVVSADNLSAQVLWITHPSPRSVGNQNWDEKTKQRLHDLELAEYFTS
ncbi:PREDICTED: single-strand selective monofunctional uracil DNA glycosylase-like isoform X1 [Polistes canadensis]|uniref:single-strand selective monofunctional uracil DNA glycosylase-like isoform X1 n=1 Tax=Polistes canadensis TaxID=91411 RepID=UPI000718BF20|nr:PREDICTED: single-strand selective monofunctional uracil DNA glycosylase-like isoform X1 [Polistes canadensis]